MFRRQIVCLMMLPFSGCSSIFTPDSTFGGAAVLNRTPEEVTVDIRIEQGDSEVHRSEHSVPAIEEKNGHTSVSSSWIECTWEPEKSGFDIYIRFQQSDSWTHFEFSEIADDGCTVAELSIVSDEADSPDGEPYNIVAAALPCDAVSGYSCR